MPTTPTTVTITINPGCSPDKPTITVHPGDTVCFVNNTGAPTTIVCDPPPVLAPPSIGPINVGGTGCGKVTATTVRETDGYHCEGSSTGMAIAGGGGGGIIIVDPTNGAPHGKRKGQTNAKAAKKPKAKPKPKPKKKAKPKTKGRARSKGRKKAAPRRKKK